MRKTIATVVILGIVWIGYVAWPIFDLLVLVRAMEARRGSAKKSPLDARG
jgi:hypothetical protein